ncbi:MAG: hypothetical protein IIB21_03760, partial [Chloroflexi bacterium]|nr:hypothetical protein [Chloroflexota bacterium]
MHVTRLSVRLIALIAVIGGVVLALSALGLGRPGAPQETALAAGDITGTSCADLYLHSIELVGETKNPPAKGTLPDGLPRVAQALTRIEDSQKNPGTAWTVITTTYLGPDQNDDLIPDQPPTKLDCQQKGDIVSGDAEVTNHKLTWQTPAVEDEPWDRVDVYVNSNGDIKNILFTCQNTGEKELVNDPKDKIEFVSEVWSAEFAQKCITESTGVSMEVNWVGLSTGAIKAKCDFSNTNTPLLLQPC